MIIIRIYYQVLIYKLIIPQMTQLLFFVGNVLVLLNPFILKLFFRLQMNHILLMFISLVILSLV